MAASGLNPKHRAEIGGTDEDSVCDIVEFAIAMRQKLQEVNMDAFNTFQLRVGISSGPLISGVIGARKPIFDVWGNTGKLRSFVTFFFSFLFSYLFEWKIFHYSKCCFKNGFNW